MSSPPSPQSRPAPTAPPYEEGVRLLAGGDIQAARDAFTQAISRDPSHAAAHYQLGNCLRLLGDAAGAERSLQTAIQRDGSLDDAYISLAYLYRSRGRLQAAADTLLALAAKHPGDWMLLMQIADLLTEMDRPAEAVSIYERCLQQNPKLPQGHTKLGLAYQKLGRFEEAERVLLAAIEAYPDSDAAYLRLAHTRRWRTEDRPLIEKLEAALTREAVGHDTRVCLHFALGKMYDDLGLYDLAYGHFQQGNELRHGQLHFDREALMRYVQDMKRICTPELFRAQAQDPGDAPTPVFVVGMLRSGTTLVERILASHPHVRGLGETEMVDALAERLAAVAGRPYPDCLEGLTPAMAQTLAAAFHTALPEDARRAAKVVDKNPLNFLHLGLIALIFPSAPILHCVRDPLDTCLSVYFQHFAHVRNNYAYDLGDIAFFYKRYTELMNHWRAVLPAPMHEIRYEDLVTDPETQSRRLVAAAGLPWHPDCLKPEEQRRSISTASLWQARQPINRDSVGRWRHYASHLDGLRRALTAT